MMIALHKNARTTPAVRAEIVTLRSSATVVPKPLAPGARSKVGVRRPSTRIWTSWPRHSARRRRQ